MWLASNFILYSWKSLSSISRAVCRIIFISPPFFLKFISPIWKIHWQVQQDVGKCNMIYRHFLSVSSPFLPLLISAVPISLIQAFKIFSWHHINDTQWQWRQILGLRAGKIHDHFQIFLLVLIFGCESSPISRNVRSSVCPCVR